MIKISIKMSLKFFPRVRSNNILALVQIMAWRRPGDKPLSQPNFVSFLTHICVTRPQWININCIAKNCHHKIFVSCWSQAQCDLPHYIRRKVMKNTLTVFLKIWRNHSLSFQTICNLPFCSQNSIYELAMCRQTLYKSNISILMDVYICIYS